MDGRKLTRLIHSLILLYMEVPEFPNSTVWVCGRKPPLQEPTRFIRLFRHNIPAYDGQSNRQTDRQTARHRAIAIPVYYDGNRPIKAPSALVQSCLRRIRFLTDFITPLSGSNRIVVVVVTPSLLCRPRRPGALASWHAVSTQYSYWARKMIVVTLRQCMHAC